MSDEVPDLPQPALPSLNLVGRRLIAGLGIYAFSSFALKAINFLLIAVYSRYLRPADYGLVALSDITALVVVTIGGLGLNNAIVRLYFQHRSAAGHLRRFVASNLRFSLVLYAFLASALFALGWLLNSTIAASLRIAFIPYIALSLGTALGSQIIDFRLGLFQAEEKARSYVWLSAVVMVLVAAGVLSLVVLARLGALGLLCGKLLGTMCAAAVALVWLRQWFGAEWNWPAVKESLHLGLPLVPHQLIALGLVAADRFILSRYRGLGEIGLYSMAYTMGMMMYLVTNAVALAWSPLFYSLAAEGEAGNKSIGRVSRTLIAGLALIASLGALLAQPASSWFLDVKYASAGRLIPLIIGGYLMHSLFSLFQLSLFQAKKTSRIATVTVFALMLNITLNLLWVPRYGMYGAAYATLLAYALEAALLYLAAQRSFHVPYRQREIVFWCVMFLGVMAFTQTAWALQPRYEFVVLIGLTASIYFLIRKNKESFSKIFARRNWGRF